MRSLARCGWFGGLGAAALLTTLLALTGSAQAAFPGRNGLLAVLPLGPQRQPQALGIVVVNRNGGGLRHVVCTTTTVNTTCPGYLPSPRAVWASDGRTLLISGAASTSAPPESPVVIYPDGRCLNCGSDFLLPGDAGYTSDPTLFTAVIDGGPQAELVQYGIDGLARQVLLSRSGAISDPVWSSRGELALVQGGRIWVGSPGNLRRLTRGSAPSWSPGGRQIAFDRGGWVMIAQEGGGSVRRLVRGTAPAWSPDGRWIAFFDARHRLDVIPARGGRVRRVGKVTGRTVDWQPLPAKPPAPCRTPPGSTVIANSDSAFVSLENGLAPPGYPFTGTWASMGCLRANGREWLLTIGFRSFEGFSNVSEAAVAGNYAALAIHNVNAHYGGMNDGVTVYDLRTGATVPNRGGEGTGCPDFGGCVTSIDQLVLGSDAISAVHTTFVNNGSTFLNNGCGCTIEQIQASDSTGTHTLDSVTQTEGSPPALTNVTLTGDTLTWQHNGTPRSAQLQP